MTNGYIVADVAIKNGLFFLRPHSSLGATTEPPVAHAEPDARGATGRAGARSDHLY
jgi:hypothetical protein